MDIKKYIYNIKLYTILVCKLYHASFTHKIKSLVQRAKPTKHSFHIKQKHLTGEVNQIPEPLSLTHHIPGAQSKVKNHCTGVFKCSCLETENIRDSSFETDNCKEKQHATSA